MELNDRLYEEITKLCEIGDSQVAENHYDKAIESYIKALDLVPTPKEEWEASTWIYTALGDTCFLKGDYKIGKDYLFNALNCPDGLSNPFILLRLGECLQELGEFKEAKEYLLKAYMVDGFAIFHSENKKYFGLIKDNV